jgi:hypothetical protein
LIFSARRNWKAFGRTVAVGSDVSFPSKGGVFKASLLIQDFAFENSEMGTVPCQNPISSFVPRDDFAFRWDRLCIETASAKSFANAEDQIISTLKVDSI